MRYPFKNLVFEGGGVKGIAYVGAMKSLEKRKAIQGIERCGGTSAGAIFATLIALGYTSEEMESIVLTTDFKKFLDEEKSLVDQVRDVSHLITKFGWYSGAFFHRWIGGHIANKLGRRTATFGDMARKTGMRELYVTCTNLSTGFGEVFSFENTPEVKIADAVRASMAIPLLYASVSYAQNDIMVDGGVVNIYPVKLFDRYKYIDKRHRKTMAVETDYYKTENEEFCARNPNASPYAYNKQTLGFHLDNPDMIGVFRDQRQPHQADIHNLLDFSRALTKAIMNSIGNKHLHVDDWDRTVYINTLGVAVTDFGLSNEQKRALIKSGYQGTEKYFQWYDNANSTPRNCPKRGICALPSTDQAS